MFNETLLDGYVYGWLTNLQALLSNRTRFVCSLLNNVGHLPWQLELGLDIYLVCWLMSPKCLKAQGGIFRHLPLSWEYSVSLMHVCVLYKHRGLSWTPVEKSVVGGFSRFGLFVEVFVRQVLDFSLEKPMEKGVACFHRFCSLWLCQSEAQWKSKPQLCHINTVKTSKASGWKAQPCSACLGWSLSQW